MNRLMCRIFGHRWSGMPHRMYEYCIMCGYEVRP